jgi:hypothetical protein
MAPLSLDMSTVRNETIEHSGVDGQSFHHRTFIQSSPTTPRVNKPARNYFGLQLKLLYKI